MVLSNYHTHTTYCDGECTAREMIDAAVALGFRALGFSGHAHTTYANYEMSFVDTGKYVSEIRALKEEYSGRIEIFCGIEQDFLSDTPTGGFDYVIGSTHSITVDGKERIVDWSEEVHRAVISECFGGDPYAFAEAYFEREADVAVKTNADIIGHFDLVAKFNENNAFFDESSPRYRDAAIGAMCKILKTCNLFEVNTGAMSRLGRTAPYPSKMLLRELLSRGGEVVISSDSHNTNTLNYQFAEMENLLRSVGFTHRKALSSGGFININL